MAFSYKVKRAAHRAWTFLAKEAHVVRGVLVFVLFEMFSAGPDAMMNWDAKRWALGALFGFVMAIRAGAPNVKPTPLPPGSSNGQ